MDKEAVVVAVREAVEYIQGKSAKLGAQKPAIGLVLGSGLGLLAEQVEDPVRIPFADIPNFPVPTAAGHSGNLIIGKIAGKSVAAMQGRVHYWVLFIQQYNTGRKMSIL